MRFLRKICPSALKNAAGSLEIAGFCSRISPFWRPGYLKVYSRASRICRQARFEPDEAYRLGLFKPEFDPQNLSSFISRKALTKIQERFNPPALAELTKNKGLFHYHCLRCGIPVPRLFLISREPRQFWHRSPMPALSTHQEKKTFLSTDLPDTFIIKPLYGAYGKGVRVLRRRQERFVDHLDKYYDVAELLSLLESKYPDGFIIQQRIENHSIIVALTGCEALQTVRMITFVDNNGLARLVHSHFKPITIPGIVIDTYMEGLVGNVEVPVNLDSGVLDQGNQIGAKGPGIIKIPCHPVTGRTFAGFEMPLWRQALETVKHAAVNFMPIRTIGWDVAFANDKIYIIEANIWWDPPNQHKRMNEILGQIQD